MEGLLYKEFCMFKPQFKGGAFVLLFFIVYGLIFKNISMIAMMISVLGLVSCFNSFIHDKQYRCDEFLTALPVSRKELVWSKYIFMFCLDLTLVSISLIMTLGYAVWTGEPVLELFSGVGSMMAVIVLMQVILMPMVYILGIDKARMVISVIISVSVFRKKDL